MPDARVTEPQPSPVSLWWAPLDASAAELAELAASLAPEERRRAEGFRRPLDRDRFLAGRGWLRRLLAGELACPAAAVRIITDAGGKPRVAGSDLRFSAARSADLALYATSWDMDVGVDVERIRVTADVDLLAARCFSPGERRALAAVPPADRLAASFRCWTSKEAYVKGIGTGLTFPLATVDTWGGGRRFQTVSGWAVHQVDLASGFAAAVAGAALGDRVPDVARNLGRFN